MRILPLLALAACATSPEPLPTDAAPPPLVLEVPELLAGTPTVFTVTGANPGDRVVFVASTSGFGTGPCLPALGGQCIGIANPVRIGSDRADATGYAELSLTIPASLQDQLVWVQAIVPAGAGSYFSNEHFDVVLDPACPMILADFEAETDAIRSCTTAAECGQVLTGTSCGCTRDWVARNGVDTSDFYDLLQAAGSCGGGAFSTCDCPAANGFDCVNNTCTWNYN